MHVGLDSLEWIAGGAQFQSQFRMVSGSGEDGNGVDEVFSRSDKYTRALLI